MISNQSDLIDRANDIAQSQTDEAVDAVRRAAAPEQDPNNVDPYCCDCGEEIEDGRLKLFKKRCIACQTVFEKRAQGYGHNRNVGGTWGDRY